jgi:hypothetical protein
MIVKMVPQDGCVPVHSDITAIRMIGHPIPFSIVGGWRKWQLALDRLPLRVISAVDLVDANGLTGCGNLTSLDANIASSRLEVRDVTRCISVDNLEIVWQEGGLMALDANK